MFLSHCFLFDFFILFFHSELAKHNSLNYLFEVTPDQGSDVQLPVFDAAYIGNGTRFLNHMTDGKENVEARSMSFNVAHSRKTDMYVKAMLVIGEHQIGFFTSEYSAMMSCCMDVRMFSREKSQERGGAVPGLRS